jgi:hypothetical protein
MKGQCLRNQSESKAMISVDARILLRGFVLRKVGASDCKNKSVVINPKCFHLGPKRANFYAQFSIVWLSVGKNK